MDIGQELTRQEMQEVSGGVAAKTIVTATSFIMGIGNFLVGFYNGWQKYAEQNN